jgi:Domain of unknown function (DUF4365)
MCRVGRPVDNSLQGDFGEAWIEAVAAGSGLLRGRPATLDLQKADVQLTLPGLVAGTYNPSVLVQVKTTVNLRKSIPVGRLLYNLDIDTYNVLRRTDHSIRRVLAVIGLRSKDGERVRLTSAGTLLVGHGAWVSLEGRPPTSNVNTVGVSLPADNTLDPAGLHRMLQTYGVRTSTPVPDVDPWETP